MIFTRGHFLKMGGIYTTRVPAQMVYVRILMGFSMEMNKVGTMCAGHSSINPLVTIPIRRNSSQPNPTARCGVNFMSLAERHQRPPALTLNQNLNNLYLSPSLLTWKRGYLA